MKREFFLPTVAKSLLIGNCAINGAFSLILWRLVVIYLYIFFKENRKEPQHFMLNHKGTTTFVTGRPGLGSCVFNTGWRGKHRNMCVGVKNKLKMAAGRKELVLKAAVCSVI